MAASVLAACTRCWAVLIVSEPVAAADDLPPAPPVLLTAADRPADSGGTIVVSWVLSPDDRVSFVGASSGSYIVGTGPQSIRRQRGITGYRIYRLTSGQDAAVAIAEVGAGVEQFVDDAVANGIAYSYDVRSFDASGNEGALQFEPGSSADAARTAVARDDSFLPVDDNGVAVRGWFNRADATVGLDDFFLFADHFGRIEGELEFAPQFDLNADFRIDLGDFFIFADNFGKTVANFAELGPGE